MLHTLAEIGAILGIAGDKLKSATRNLRSKVLCDGEELYSVGQFRRPVVNPVKWIVSRQIRSNRVAIVRDCSRKSK